MYAKQNSLSARDIFYGNEITSVVFGYKNKTILIPTNWIEK